MECDLHTVLLVVAMGGRELNKQGNSALGWSRINPTTVERDTHSHTHSHHRGVYRFFFFFVVGAFRNNTYKNIFFGVVSGMQHVGET